MVHSYLLINPLGAYLKKQKQKIATVPSRLQELLSQSLQGSTWKSEFLANVQNDLYD